MGGGAHKHVAKTNSKKRGSTGSTGSQQKPNQNEPSWVNGKGADAAAPAEFAAPFDPELSSPCP